MATLGEDEGDVKADDACAVVGVSLMIRLSLVLEGHRYPTTTISCCESYAAMMLFLAE